MLSDAPFPQKWSCPQKRFFAVVSQNMAFFFSKKLTNEKIFKISFPIKKKIKFGRNRGEMFEKLKKIASPCWRNFEKNLEM